MPRAFQGMLQHYRHSTEATRLVAPVLSRATLVFLKSTLFLLDIPWNMKLLTVHCMTLPSPRVVENSMFLHLMLSLWIQLPNYYAVCVTTYVTTLQLAEPTRSMHLVEWMLPSNILIIFVLKPTVLGSLPKLVPATLLFTIRQILAVRKCCKPTITIFLVSCLNHGGEMMLRITFQIRKMCVKPFHLFLHSAFCPWRVIADKKGTPCADA